MSAVPGLWSGRVAVTSRDEWSPLAVRPARPYPPLRPPAPEGTAGRAVDPLRLCPPAPDHSPVAIPDAGTDPTLRLCGAARIPPPVPAESAYATDDDLIAATRADGVPRVRVIRPDRAMVVLGRGSRAADELDLAACAADGVPVLRRAGGGCAVVLDPGNVVVSAAVPQRGLPRIRALFDGFTAWLLDGLGRAGVSGVRRADVSDLVVGDRKVGGACLYRPGGVAYWSATVLVAPDVALMARWLAHPPREPAYRRGRRHAEFVGRLADLPGGWTAERLAEALRRTLGAPEFAGSRGGPS
jgi:lipoate---protein ligase